MIFDSPTAGRAAQPRTAPPRSQFAHVLFCLQLYLLSPFMRRHVRSASPAAHVGLTAAMAAAAAALLAPLSGALAGLFAAGVMSVSLLCPWALVRIHKFKAKINGPWDEAVPHIPTALASGGAGGGGGRSGAGAAGGGAGGRVGEPTRAEPAGAVAVGAVAARRSVRQVVPGGRGGDRLSDHKS